MLKTVVLPFFLMLAVGGCVVGDEVPEDGTEEVETTDDVAYCSYRLCGIGCTREGYSDADWYCCSESDDTCWFYLNNFLRCSTIDRQDGHNGQNDCRPPGGGGGGGGDTGGGGGGGGGGYCHEGGPCEDYYDCPGGTCGGDATCYCSGGY